MGIRGAERESENRRAEQKWRNGGAERGRGSEKRSGSRESEERIRGAEQRIGAGAGNGAAEREWGLEERSAGAEQRSGAVWGSEDTVSGKQLSEGTRFIKTSFARPGVLHQFTLVV